MVVLRIQPRILRKEYGAFLDLLLYDEEFPTTYDEWRESAAQQREYYRARGQIVKDITIHPREFANWCRATDVEPRTGQLIAFAVAKAHWKKEY